MIRSVAVSDLRRPLAAGVAVAALAVVGFAVAEVLDVGVLVDPERSMAASGPAALVGVALLAADVVLPVPSSLVMLAHGALFGAVAGTVLNLLGRTVSAVVGVVLGRAVRTRAATDEGDEGDGRGGRLVGRWGLAAVVVTRPVPVLSEATVVAAGAAGLAGPAVVGAAALGSIPEAVIYAVAGATAPTAATGIVLWIAMAALAGASIVVATRRRAGRAGIQPPQPVSGGQGGTSGPPPSPPSGPPSVPPSKVMLWRGR